MIASILSIGDELLIGQVVNTNASWLGARLTEIGWQIGAVVAIGDSREGIRREIERLAATADVVIVSGGLGPTHDDVTREAICDLLGCEMRMDEEQLQRIERRFARAGIELNERSRRQAMVPAACRVLPNEYGSAPCLSFSVGESRIYVLPGVPSELKGITSDRILPELREGAGEIERTTFLVFGPTESGLADMLAHLNELLDRSVTLAYLPSLSGIRLRAMRLGDENDAVTRYRRLVEGIRAVAGEWIVTGSDEPFAAALGRIMIERRLTLAVAESCTGGMIGAEITAISGSSAWFLGGAISYANSAKSELLGVAADLIEQHGAVSREVAEAMASGARERLGASIAIAVTGVAGPGGGSEEKPVGTVWIAVSSERRTLAKRFQFGGEREIVRGRAVFIALDMARREVLNNFE